MRILFAGASGFGNLGDDAYRLAFDELINPHHELRFDSPYPDPKAVEWCDVLVIGGGGLVYCNNTAHFEYMSQYLGRAKELGKPWCFSSVGVQLVGADLTREQCMEQATQIEPWAPWLEGAQLLTVRSGLDRALIERVAPLAHPVVFPDICYAIKPRSQRARGNRKLRGRLRLVSDRAYVAIPTKSSMQTGAFHALYEAAQEDDAPFYVVAMARVDEDAVSDLRESLELQQGLHTFTNLSAENLIHGVLPYAQRVVTGRFHGKVLATAAGVSEIRSVDRRIKSRFEDEWHDPVSGWRHAAMLNRVCDERLHPFYWSQRGAS